MKSKNCRTKSKGEIVDYKRLGKNAGYKKLRATCRVQKARGNMQDAKG